MRRHLMGLVVVLGLMAGSAEAGPIFHFSFSDGGGAVTGRILGLAETGTGAASQVFIDSISNVGLAAAFPPVAFDVLAFYAPASNTFTTVNNVITSALFSFGFNNNVAGGFHRSFQLSSNLSFGNGLEAYTFAANGFDVSPGTYFATGGAPTFRVDPASIAATPVPEPGTLALLGFGTVGLVSRRRRRQD